MVSSLLTAIVEADGDALVMHVGEQPYVVSASGPVELSSRALTLEAVTGMLAQLLPADSRRTLDEIGAVEHDLPPSASGDGERFTVVAARGGDDIWIEIRRHRTMPAEGDGEAAGQPAPSEPFQAAAEDSAAAAGSSGSPSAASDDLPPAESEATPAAPPAEARSALEAQPDTEPAPSAEQPPPEPESAPPPEPESTPLPSPEPEPEPEPTPLPEPEPTPPEPEPAPTPTPEPEPAPQPPPAPQPVPDRPSAPRAPVEPLPAVRPLARMALRTEAAARPVTPARIAGLDRLLRLAAARGATTLHLMSGTRPSIRVDGAMTAIEGEPVLGASEVEALLLELAPDQQRDASGGGEGSEWGLEVPEAGRYRCQVFRDVRGPGGTFRLVAARPASVEQLGLSKEVQALAAEASGLVIVAGPRSSGKSTLISAFVDLINRTRTDYVITVESQIACAHDNRGCLVSQREVRGGSDEIAAAVRAAVRENPDVLVIDDLRSPAVVDLALEAMARGHLVVGAMSAHTAAAAVGRILAGIPPDRREQARVMLAEGFRGSVSQVLLRKPGGGRVAAREVILNTPAVTSVIADGRLSQLPLAVDSGRKYGCVPLNDALAGFVQSGIVDVRDAYRQAFDRAAFLSVLRREGIDTSFAERLA